MTDCEVQLELDVRTRWNSTLTMIRTFLANEAALRKFYDSSRRKRGEEFPLDVLEISAIKRVAKSLEHAERATLRLSEKDTSISLADIALEVSYRGGPGI